MRKQSRTHELSAREFIHASWILDAVEDWAGSQLGEYWLVRETAAGVVGRIDGLLVPASFNCHVFKAQRGHWLSKAAVVGVEVKASREDFLRGVREKQFERYAADLAGLYVATGRFVKTSEIPEGIGHLVVYRPPERREWACVCKRHPTYRQVEMSPDFMWQLIFQAVKKVRQGDRQNRERIDRALERIGSVAERQIMSVLRKAAEEVK